MVRYLYYCGGADMVGDEMLMVGMADDVKVAGMGDGEVFILWWCGYGGRDDEILMVGMAE